MVMEMIENKRIKNLMEIADKYRISPAVMAHIIGVSISTYYRYKKGDTIPQSQNTRNIIDSVIKAYSLKNE